MKVLYYRELEVTYIILINFLDHLFQADVFDTKLYTGLLKFFLSNIATSVSVKVRKCCKKMIFSFNLVSMQCCSNKLPVTNSSTIVNISLQCKMKQHIKNLATKYMI